MLEHESVKEKSALIWDILFWFLFALGIGVVIWIFLGKSPTMEQGLLLLILTMVIKNSIEIKGKLKD